MKLTIQHILDLSQICMQVKDLKMTLKASYKFSKLNAAIDEAIEFYRAQLNNLIGIYGLKDENGNLVNNEDGQSIKITEGLEQECTDELNKLYAFEVDMPDVVFTVDELENLSISPREFEILKPFVK